MGNPNWRKANDHGQGSGYAEYSPNANANYGGNYNYGGAGAGHGGQSGQNRPANGNANANNGGWYNYDSGKGNKDKGYGGSSPPGYKGGKGKSKGKTTRPYVVCKCGKWRYEHLLAEAPCCIECGELLLKDKDQEEEESPMDYKLALVQGGMPAPVPLAGAPCTPPRSQTSSSQGSTPSSTTSSGGTSTSGGSPGYQSDSQDSGSSGTINDPAGLEFKSIADKFGMDPRITLEIQALVAKAKRSPIGEKPKADPSCRSQAKLQAEQRAAYLLQEKSGKIKESLQKQYDECKSKLDNVAKSLKESGDKFKKDFEAWQQTQEAEAQGAIELQAKLGDLEQAEPPGNMECDENITKEELQEIQQLEPDMQEEAIQVLKGQKQAEKARAAFTAKVEAAAAAKGGGMAAPGSPVMPSIAEPPNDLGGYGKGKGKGPVVRSTPYPQGTGEKALEQAAKDAAAKAKETSQGEEEAAKLEAEAAAKLKDKSQG